MRDTNPIRWLIILCLVPFATSCNPLGNAIYVKIKDDNGSPVSNAGVTFSWSTNEPWGPSTRSGDRHQTTVATDLQGLASTRIAEDHYVRMDVTHALHYAASVVVVDSGLSQHTTPGAALSIPLKRIIAPCPLVAKRAYIILPGLSGEAAYDFLIGDFVAPLGKGSVADITFTWSHPPTGGKIEARKHFDILFPQPNCGIVARRISNEHTVVESSLRSDRSAPDNGYLPSIRAAETAAGFGERGAWGEEGIIYYVRISRTGAFRYGKILGEPGIIFYDDSLRPVIEFTYAINPSGDISLEPDLNTISFPKSNAYEKPYGLPEY